MDGRDFDRIAKFLARGLSRRGFIAAAGLAIAARERVFANQLTPSTCGAAGEVCTHLLGCCGGLTCATSSINVNYGVCIPGDGGTIAVGTSLISPFSEGVEQELAALAAEQASTEATDTTTTTDTATTNQEERDARIAAAEARRTANEDAQQLRKDQKKIDKDNRKAAKKRELELSLGPRLAFQVLNPGGGSGTETVKVSNIGNVSIVLNRIESFLNPSVNTNLSPPRPLGVGASFLFLSGVPLGPTNLPNEIAWNDTRVCSEAPGDGFVISAGFSANSANHEYVVLCDQVPVVAGSPPKSKKKKKSRGGRKPGNKSGKKNKKRQRG